MKAIRKQGVTYKTLALSTALLLQMTSCSGDVNESVPPPGGEGGSGAPGAGGAAPGRPVVPPGPAPGGAVGGAPGGAGGAPATPPAPPPTPTPPPPPITTPPTVPPAPPTPPVANPALDEVCTPPVTLQNDLAQTGAGGMRFNMFVPDTQATMQELSRAVCKLLYRKPEEVRRNARITVVIDSGYNGVAYAGGGQIHFSSAYIAGRGGNAASQEFEIKGVLAHEVTHLWQQNRGGTGANREAVADYARYKVGFDRLSRRRPGGNWSDAYTTGGFFIVWLEDKYDKDFGYKLNMGIANANFSYPNLVQEVTGKNIDAAWAEYQAELRMMDVEPKLAAPDYETQIRIVSGHQNLVDRALDLRWRRE